MAEVFVNRKGARRIRDGHLWIYKSDVQRVEAAGGDIVSVFDEARNFVGKAFYSDASEISLRFLTTKDENIDRNFLAARIRQSIRRRASLGEIRFGNFTVSNATNARRLFYSEADLIPSLILDDYNGVLVLQTLTQGTDKLKTLFVEIFVEELKPKAIVERNDVLVRRRENLPLMSGLIYGESPEEFTVTQNGLNFMVAPFAGQKTGAFLDQSENHFAIRKFARGDALDCFTFNGGFALNLAEVCKSVLALDISEEAIAVANRNASLNNIHNVEFRAANVFDALREFETEGRRFDTIVLDPPAFVKNRSALKSAMRGYKEINLRALKLLNPSGILVSCSCSFHVSESMLQEVIEDSARDAKRRLHLLEKRMQASDHPSLLGVPESSYLKCLIFEIIGEGISRQK